MRGALVAGLAILVALGGGAAVPTVAAAGPPNIVLILTDDQRWDTLRRCRTCRQLLVDPA